MLASHRCALCPGRHLTARQRRAIGVGAVGEGVGAGVTDTGGVAGGCVSATTAGVVDTVGAIDIDGDCVGDFAASAGGRAAIAGLSTFGQENPGPNGLPASASCLCNPVIALLRMAFSPMSTPAAIATASAVIPPAYPAATGTSAGCR